MIKLRLVLTLGLAVVVSIGAWRYRALRELQLEQALLSDRIEQANEAHRAASRSESLEPPPDALSPEERSELLKLRAQFGRLSQQLAHETDEASRMAARFEQLEPTTEAAEEPIVSRAEALARMNQGKQWVVAMMIHSRETGGPLPRSLDEVTVAAGVLESADRFEILLPLATLDSVQSPSRTIVLREKEPWRMGTSRWGRIYAFADGHVETAVSSTRDFTEWEEKLRTTE